MVKIIVAIHNKNLNLQACGLAKNGEAPLVVDEIQKIKSWAPIVKLLWDEDNRLHAPLKVILTGSSSLLLQKGLEESLFFSGYPGAFALIKDEVRWARYMGASIVEPTLSHDILMMEEVRKPALLRSLFMLGSGYSAQELSFTKMLGQLQDAGNTVTLAHYLELLGKANTLTGLQNYSGNRYEPAKVPLGQQADIHLAVIFIVLVSRVPERGLYFALTIFFYKFPGSQYFRMFYI